MHEESDLLEKRLAASALNAWIQDSRLQVLGRREDATAQRMGVVQAGWAREDAGLDDDALADGRGARESFGAPFGKDSRGAKRKSIEGETTLMVLWIG